MRERSDRHSCSWMRRAFSIPLCLTCLNPWRIQLRSDGSWRIQPRVNSVAGCAEHSAPPMFNPSESLADSATCEFRSWMRRAFSIPLCLICLNPWRIQLRSDGSWRIQLRVNSVAGCAEHSAPPMFNLSESLADSATL